jgi:hypothetical protein
VKNNLKKNQNTNMIGLTFKLKMEPKLEELFDLKLGVFFRLGTAKIWREFDATLVPHHFFMPRTLKVCF